ncbi:MAG: HD domain-containing phosphohydrolase [Planctomycetota bacterium]
MTPAGGEPTPPDEPTSAHWFGQAIALVDELERHDTVTATHTWRVILYTRALAEDAGLDHDTVDLVALGAALHDVGKLDIAGDVLRKPGRLTDDEFAVVRTHTTLGEARLKSLGIDDPVVLQMVRSHHERLDGTGYPDGLAGLDIPRPALYFAVVDSFDAMTSRRPYQRDLPDDAEERAIAALLHERGTRYCDDAVDRFARLHEKGALDWIARHFNEDSGLYQQQIPGSGALER